MSDVPQGPGWWQASDGRWYPPESAPAPAPMPAAYGYGYGYGYGPPALPSVTGLATASLVLGILSMVLCFQPFVAVFGLVGLPLGAVALARISNGRAAPDGRGLAVAGVVLSAISLLLGLVFTVLLIAAESEAGALAPVVGGLGA